MKRNFVVTLDDAIIILLYCITSHIDYMYEQEEVLVMHQVIISLFGNQ